MNKKRITCITCLLLSVIMLFNACSFQKSPTEVATSFIEALKAQDEETLAKVYSGDWSEDGGLTSTLNSTDLGGMSKETAEKFIAKVLEFDYTYGEETINDDKATVDVTITTYNFTSMLSDMLTDLYSKAIELAFSGLTEEELEKQISRLVDLRIEIAATIGQVRNENYRLILEKRYLCFLPWDEIACEMHYSRRWVLKSHDLAVEVVEKLLAEKGSAA